LKPNERTNKESILRLIDDENVEEKDSEDEKEEIQQKKIIELNNRKK